MNRGGIALVLSGFPRRSETFALHELQALDTYGLLAAIFATKAGDGLLPHPGSERLLERICYLPAGDAEQQARALVRQLDGQPVAAIHAYFAHTPAQVAEVAANTLQIPFGFSVHARDARKVDADELARRARAAACVVACNPDVAHHFETSGVSPHIVPHGVDIERFYAQPQSQFGPGPVQLLAVGRLVEKKGFDVLIRAAAQLSFQFHLRIVGDGPQREHLEKLIREEQLTDRVELCASITHAQLPGEYAAAHIVIVPSVIDRSGDRDGLPNVILEAMASSRPVIASDVGAVSTVVTTDQTGMLAPPGDAAALARLLDRLAFDPLLCQNLAQNARLLIANHFDLRSCTQRFCHFLENTYCVHGRCSP